MGESTRSTEDRRPFSARWAARLVGVRLVMGNEQLRRLAVSWGLFNIAEYAFVVALGVYAFGEGGTLAVGVVALVRTLPGLVSGPLASVATDRWRRSRVLILGVVGRMVASAGIVVALVADQAYVVYGLAAVDAMVAASFWPAMAALTAEYSHRPSELTAANATSSLMESLGSLFGPVLAGTILLADSPEYVFLVGIGLFGFAAGIAFPLRSNRIPEVTAEGERWRQVSAGWRAMRDAPGAGRVLGLWGAESLVLGAVDVAIVVLSIDYLGLGEAGVGYLAAMGGLGGVLAAGFVSVVSQRSGRLITLGLTVFGAALVVLGIAPRAAVAFLAFGVMGAAAAWLDVGSQTLLQRLVPEGSLGRVLGLFEGLYWAALGLGGLVMSALIIATNASVAIAIVGGAMVAAGAVNARRMKAIDLDLVVPHAQLSALAAMPILAGLGTPTLERLSRKSNDLLFPAGEVIIKEGESGDRFYVIVTGTVEVDRDGHEVAELGRGDGFGEIALLRVSRETPTSRRSPTPWFWRFQGMILSRRLLVTLARQLWRKH